MQAAAVRDCEPAAAPSGPLSAESEAALAAFCALQDTLTRDEALALAREVRDAARWGCARTEQQPGVVRGDEHGRRRRRSVRCRTR